MAASALQATSVPSGDLVDRLRARDPRAARAAWTMLSPQVKHVLRRFHDAGPDREDLHQEVFLRFFARIDELRNPRSLRSFVFGICMGVARNDRRRARVRRVVELCPDEQLPEDGGVVPAPEARELAGRLRAVLSRARPVDRTLFLMRYVEQWELGEVAAAHGVSLSTARRRLSRARRRILVRLRAVPGLGELADRLGRR